MVPAQMFVALLLAAPALAAEPAGGAESPPADAPEPATAPEDPPAPTGGSPAVQTNVEVREMSGFAEAQVYTVEVQDPSKQPPPAEVATWQPPEAAVVVPPPTGSPLLAERPPAYDLPVVHKVFPRFPENYAILHGNTKIRCVARVWVDRHGAPLRSAVMDCPAGMHLLAATALSKWRWEKPDVNVPPGGLEVEAVVGFLRDVSGREGKPYFPGVTWLDNPLEITADPSRPALVRSGNLPAYPEQVIHGDAVCQVELTVSRAGTAKDVLIDGCSLPYREATFAAVKRWKFYPAVENGEEIDSEISADIVFALEQPAAAGRPGGP
ncbi:MAG TPA: energy transducer TonB [Myxococcota bacterium]|nr:energy transducer TonB [Myxococcota bacterium]